MLVLRELRDAEREPVLTVTAAGHDLREDALRLLVALILHQLLGEDAAAVEVILAVDPVLLETGEQVLEADRDGATLLVLDLHRGALKPRSFQTCSIEIFTGPSTISFSTGAPFGPSGMSTIAFAGTPFGNDWIGARIAAPPWMEMPPSCPFGGPLRSGALGGVRALRRRWVVWLMAGRGR